MKLYKLIFVANAFLLLISIYLTNKGVAIGKIPLEFRGKSLSIDIPDWISYCIYFGIPILTTWCETKSFRKLDPTEIKSEAINSIESASSTFLPTFFAYVFVGLSNGITNEQKLRKLGKLLVQMEEENLITTIGRKWQVRS